MSQLHEKLSEIAQRNGANKAWEMGHAVLDAGRQFETFDGRSFLLTTGQLSCIVRLIWQNGTSGPQWTPKRVQMRTLRNLEELGILTTVEGTASGWREFAPGVFAPEPPRPTPAISVMPEDPEAVLAAANVPVPATAFLSKLGTPCTRCDHVQSNHHTTCSHLDCPCTGFGEQVHSHPDVALEPVPEEGITDALNVVAFPTPKTYRKASGGTVELTPAEFALLAKLYRLNGVTRNKLTMPTGRVSRPVLLSLELKGILRLDRAASFPDEAYEVLYASGVFW